MAYHASVAQWNKSGNMICKYCNEETGLRGGAQGNHVRWCLQNPDRERNIEKNKESLKRAREIRRSKPSSNQYIKAKQEGRKYIDSNEIRNKKSIAATGRKHTVECKEKISKSRKKWLKENPDLHPWKTNEKFVSVPCEVLKKKLIERGLKFEDEYSPLEDRFFAIDIAFPEIKFAIEVNGEQHYTRDGILTSYYQERHDLLVNEGWSILELHYVRCYEPHVDSIVENIIASVTQRKSLKLLT